jgi:hypothetical protein
MLLDLTFPRYLTTFSGKSVLAGRFSVLFFVPLIEVLLYYPITIYYCYCCYNYRMEYHLIKCAKKGKIIPRFRCSLVSSIDSAGFMDMSVCCPR